MTTKPEKYKGPVVGGQYKSGRTPIMDFVENVFGHAMMAVFMPIIVVVVLAAPAWALVAIVLQPTGLVAAWSDLVTAASAVPAEPVSFATALALNFMAAAVISGVLSLPYVRRTLDNMRGKWAADALDVPQSVAAAGSGVTCLALHLVLAAGIASVLTALGLMLPGTGAEAVVNAGSLLGQGIPGGGGPPDVQAMADGMILLWLIVVVSCIVVGAALGAGVAIMTALFAAMGGAASAAGGIVGAAWTSGDEKTRRRLKFGTAMMAGVWKGVVSGLVYTAVLLAGAALIGVR